MSKSEKREAQLAKNTCHKSSIGNIPNQFPELENIPNEDIIEYRKKNGLPDIRCLVKDGKGAVYVDYHNKFNEQMNNDSYTLDSRSNSILIHKDHCVQIHTAAFETLPSIGGKASHVFSLNLYIKIHSPTTKNIAISHLIKPNLGKDTIIVRYYGAFHAEHHKMVCLIVDTRSNDDLRTETFVERYLLCIDYSNIVGEKKKTVNNRPVDITPIWTLEIENPTCEFVVDQHSAIFFNNDQNIFLGSVNERNGYRIVEYFMNKGMNLSDNYIFIISNTLLNNNGRVSYTKYNLGPYLEFDYEKRRDDWHVYQRFWNCNLHTMKIELQYIFIRRNGPDTKSRMDFETVVYEYALKSQTGSFVCVYRTEYEHVPEEFLDTVPALVLSYFLYGDSSISIYKNVLEKKFETEQQRLWFAQATVSIFMSWILRNNMDTTANRVSVNCSVKFLRILNPDLPEPPLRGIPNRDVLISLDFCITNDGQCFTLGITNRDSDIFLHRNRKRKIEKPFEEKIMRCRIILAFFKLTQVKVTRAELNACGKYLIFHDRKIDEDFYKNLKICTLK